MNLTTYFTDNGEPAIGKSPVISIWTLDGSQVVVEELMSEIASGFYVYNFTGYSQSSEYVFQGFESTLPSTEQYVVGTNDIDSQRNPEIIKQILGLVQSNFKMTNQFYDTNGNMESAIIHTYDSAADTNSDINRLHTYFVSASYNAEGKLVDYKVTDV